MESNNKRYTVLAVDDEPLMLKTYIRMLRGEFNILTAAGVKEALNILEMSDQIDTILLDNMMPELSGLDGIPLIREMDNYRQTPIFMVTGDNSEALQHEALNLGASDFLAKPLSPSLLRLRIKLHADNAKLKMKLEQLALADSLTELSNRRGMQMQLQRELRRCRRSGLTFSLAVVDIDHFKKINDTYGHSVGDQAIKLVANVMKEFFKRGTDVLARYGGEEFIIGSIEVEPEDMQNRIKTFRKEIKHRRLIVNEKPIDDFMTVSVGGITLIPDNDIDEIDEIIERADKCLYKAKQTRDAQVWEVDLSGSAN